MKENKKDWKCKLSEDGQLTKRCNGLDMCLNQEANARMKGLSLVVVCNLSKGLFDIVRGVCYKTSAIDKGLMLNVCPFCGEPIIKERKTNTNTEIKND